MKKSLGLFILLILLSIIIPARASAMTCTGEGVCSVVKSDFETKDIGDFLYQSFSFNESDKGAAFMGESGFYTATGTYRSLGYWIKDDEYVKYNASIMEFNSRKDMTALLKEYLSDNREKEYKNKYGSAFRIVGANGSTVLWAYKNLILSVHATSDADQTEKFIDQAFSVYAKKFPPEKIDLKKLRVVEKPRPVKNPYPIAFTAPGQGEPLHTGEKIKIKWTSNKKVFPKVDLWITDTDEGTYTKYIATNIKNKGSYSWKIPKDFKTGQYMLSIGIPGEAYMRYGMGVNISRKISPAN